uniref:Cytochrome P450 CYP439A3 n=1 Tax=Sogatella furcifera TaxID=113103 RepID=A0A1Q1NKX6_SOGFU|nr:cytochrome P450 CYP439A3 [Sogatella furcifera]
MIIWLQIIIIAIILHYVISEKLRQWRMEGNLQGPTTIPFLGNSLLFFGCEAHDIGHRIMQLQNITKYGRVWRIWIGSHLGVFVADPKSLEIILKSNEVLNKSAVYNAVADFADGIVTSSGEKWRGLRKIVNTIFHNQNIENQVNIINNSSMVLCRLLEEKCDGRIFKIDNFIHECLLDITCKIIASSKTDMQLKENLTFTDDVRLGIHLSSDRCLKVWLHPDFIYEHTTAGKLKNAIVKKILGFSLELIKERRESLKGVKNSITVDGQHEAKPKIFLDHMFDYGREKNLTDLEISKFITDVILAGYDTSSCAISYMLLMLAMYQDIQEQVYEEIYDITGDSNRPVELKDINRMACLDRVIMEVLRHCSVPHVARRVDSPLQLQDKLIPKRSTLYLMLYRLHRDPEYWSHPDSFYPDHFLPENIERRPKYTFLPFVSGPRGCPGQKLSSILMKIIVSTILRQYKVTTTVRPSEVKLSMTMMLEVSGGSQIQLTRR